jgi:metallo-beta-lactamase family protein
MLKIGFYGGANKVTGSNFLVEGEAGKLLIDCGIEQGADIVESHIYGAFPYDVKTIDALVLTHAHLDHVGRIPKLVRDGFQGKIYMTPPTKDLAELILRDSVDILREDAFRKGKEPLFEEKDVDATFSRIETLEYHTEKEAAPGLSIYLRNTGHILGSASVRIAAKDGSVAFTGDIGNSPSPLLPDWEAIPDTDVLIMESVYGNRLHPPHGNRVDILRQKLAKALAKGGTILIPAFSLERTQLMLYELSNLFSSGALPHIPVFLDSPLAISVTDVYEKWGPTYFKSDAQKEIKGEGSIFNFPFLKMTKSRGESDQIANAPEQKIIIAGAGMSHGGRIGRWETRYLPDPKTTLFIVGYQAPGSPGRLLQEGVPSVRINNALVNVRATIETMEEWSGHGDRDELLKFAEASLPRAKTIFTAIGEPAAERFLAQRIHDYLGTRAIVPDTGQTYVMKTDGDIVPA